MKTFYSNGKLLISGEYLVLDHTVALALPTKKFGQFLEIQNHDKNELLWQSFNIEKEAWFSAIFESNSLEILKTDHVSVATTLQNILKVAKNLNPFFLKENQGLKVTTRLTFPNHWGLGTSSTLINNIAHWAQINPFELLNKSFGGSGYDIACANYNTAITYQRNGIQPLVASVDFNPTFKHQLFFVYSNQKQNSKQGISLYKNIKTDKTPYHQKVNTLTYKMIEAQTLSQFEDLMNQHETLIGELLGIEPVKDKLFKDYVGSIKSLGAWGGDFMLVTGTATYVKNYFNSKGYHTILSFDEMIGGSS